MKKIVVVDDQPVLASIYCAKFAAEGFSVRVATDGQAALEVIQSAHPDLVLLDLMLPKIKGIDVLKTLRANASFKTLPILVFSSCAQPGVVEEAWAAGATMVLSKSKTSPKQLVESVIAVLNAPASTADASAVNAQPAEASVFRSNSFEGSRKKRVLLVEINSEVRAVLSLVMTREGLQLTHADGCAHALMLSEVTHFDLVLANQKLCRESPQHFCQQIRRRHANVPIVAYSMRATPGETKQALDDGVSRFITTAEELLEAGTIANAAIDASRKAA